MPRIFVVLVCFVEILAVVFSSNHEGKSKTLKNNFVSSYERTKKPPSKSSGSDGQRFQPFPSNEPDEDALLVKISPEYQYKEDLLNNNDRRHHRFDKLTSKAEQDKRIQQIPELARERLKAKSIENLNIMLQNTLPEYKYDREERGPGFTYNGCVDLDSDCKYYETDGLCSDSPYFAMKRYNCKKTCEICTSLT
ncbi:uncharacterized protein LOC124440951 [Xenia sp. Carnegie-2017]|uniref:uncharacterized protein LOC124440951 n=1 Tax=Xenia sp. Carnegie-2017 TaxID=2897299 RepID=UPI001F03BFA9|nr:uncharacterized protein LOC124440951 [Xenia sp. Carnegie-2017]